MGFWDDLDNGGGDWNYRGGAYQVNDPAPQDGSYAAPTAAPTNAPAFDQFQQVGHDGQTSEGWNREQWRDAWQSSGVKDMAGLEKWTAQHGGKVLSGNGSVMTPFGESGDILIGARTNGNGKAGWLGDGSGQTGGGQPGNLGGDVIGHALGSFGMPTGGGGQPGRGGQGGFTPYQYDNFTAPEPFQYENFKAPEAFSYDAFKAPTAEEAQQDPGYQFGLQEGQRALTNQAAKNGMLRSGMALKDFAKYATDYASTKYGDVYNRAMGNYQTNRGNAADTYDRNFGNSFSVNQANNQGRFGAYQGNFGNQFAASQANNQGRLAGFQANTNADLGYGNLNLGYTRAGNDYSLGMGNLALGNRQADQNYDLGLKGNALGWGNLGLGYGNLDLAREGQNFNQGYSLADLGLRASGLAGGYGSQYGQNAQNNATGAGNATAAGQVGSANAWNAGLSNAGNIALGAYGMYKYGQPTANY